MKNTNEKPQPDIAAMHVAVADLQARLSAAKNEIGGLEADYRSAAATEAIGGTPAEPAASIRARIQQAIIARDGAEEAHKLAHASLTAALAESNRQAAEAQAAAHLAESNQLKAAAAAELEKVRTAAEAMSAALWAFEASTTRLIGEEFRDTGGPSVATALRTEARSVGSWINTGRHAGNMALEIRALGPLKGNR